MGGMSGMLRLDRSDFVRGLVVALIGGALGVIEQALANGDVDPTVWHWPVIGGASLVSGLSYLSKNLASTSDGKVLGKIGAVLLLAPLLGGCSNIWSGTVLGGAGGLVGPGANAFKMTQTDFGCPDLSGAGSTPLSGVDISCDVNPDGSKHQHAAVASADPTQVLLKSFEAQSLAIQAQLQAAQMALTTLQQIAPVAAQAAATAAAGPAAGAAAGALAKAMTTPKPPPEPTP